MNKRVAILPIGVLSVVAIVMGIFYFQETNKLEEAQSEIVTLEVEVSALEGNVSALATELAESEVEVSALAARISPDLNVLLSEIDGLTMVVDGAVYPGIDGSIITRVHWEWGDGDSEDDWFPASHTYETYGEYTIKITAYQSDGLTSTKTFIFYAPVDTTSVTFPDANLETVIREAIDKLEGPISVSDLESLVMLEAPGKGISDLTGLEYCLNLQYLGLWDSNISDISPLAGLLNLQGLELDGNNISDISPLAGLINLEYLNLLSNNISDISSLISLTNLAYLNFWDNNISDISSLISLTNLRELWLAENSISDISALAGLFNLHTLDLADNNISDISPLVENSNLSVDDIVYLMGNPLSPTSIGIYIPQLEARGVYVAY